MGDVIVINQALRRRESATGKVRYTVDIKSEALVFNLDPKLIGAPVAKAIADSLRIKVLSIGAEASTETMARRKTAAIAIARGKPWAVKRYSGGKIGLMPPTLGPKAFNDSGRFARSIAAGAARDKWIINVAANRLDPTTGNVQRIWARLVELVPEFANQQGLLADPAVVNAIKVGLSTVPGVMPASNDEVSQARARADASKRADRFLALVAQVVIKAVA